MVLAGVELETLVSEPDAVKLYDSFKNNRKTLTTWSYFKN